MGKEEYRLKKHNQKLLLAQEGRIEHLRSALRLYSFGPENYHVESYLRAQIEDHKKKVTAEERPTPYPLEILSMHENGAFKRMLEFALGLASRAGKEPTEE